MLSPGAVSQTPTSLSGSGYGSGFSKTVLTTLNIAVFAPIPTASVISVTVVNIGERINLRTTCFS